MSGHDDAVGDLDPSAGQPTDESGADQTAAPSQTERPIPETDAAQAELQDELRSIRGYGEDRV
jgi:hypothetical protein